MHARAEAGLGQSGQAARRFDVAKIEDFHCLTPKPYLPEGVDPPGIRRRRPLHETHIGLFSRPCRIPDMRRLVALIIMLLVPLQSAWSVTSSLHGPLDKAVAAGVMHAHDHVHPADDGRDISLAGTMNGHDEDGYHDSHCHPVFNLVLAESCLTLGAALSNGPILQSATSFFSHTPPLLDRPPLAQV